MSDKHKETRVWFSLQEAAQQLGVHPTTLRRWADDGEIPVMLTPGGHRRFAVADVERFAEERRRLRMVPGIERLWAEQALHHARSEVEIHRDKHWLQALGDKEHEPYRVLGRRMMGIILQYVSHSEGGDSLLNEARAIGAEYAHHTAQLGLPVTSALEAAMFFRDSMVEVAIQLPEHAHLRPEANTNLLRRTNAVLNVVQLAMVEAYNRNA